jgi:N-acetylglucosaminyldiphosphoundecaprenol N-acetyl-beta-D-mannosaminyltransferase
MNTRDREIVVLLGIPFDNLDMDATVLRIKDFILSGQPHYVATANVNFVAKAMYDEEFQEIVRLADIITADGMPLVWASRLIGHPLRERVTGSDLVPKLVSLAAREGWGVFFLGGEEGVAKEAIQRLKVLYPGLKADSYCPEFKPLHDMSNAKILAVIHEAAPKMLFVSLGAGKAEKWIRMHLKELNVPVCIGVGATIDFLAGRVKRAPLWMQQAGLEWLWRIMQEPGRLFKRYLFDLPVFSASLLRQWWMERSIKAPADRPVEQPYLTRQGRVKILSPGERLDASTAASVAGPGSDALERKMPLVIDLAATSFMDSSGLGALVGLQKQARDAAIPMALAGMQPRIASLIKLARMEAFFSMHAAAGEAVASVTGQQAVRPLQAQPDGTQFRIQLEGRLDAFNSRNIREALFRMIHQAKGWKTMVLDCSALDFMDSSGVSTLILLNKKLTNERKELVLEGLRPGPLGVIRLARLEHYFGLEKRK